MKRWVKMSAAAAALLSCCVARGATVKTPRGLRKIEELQVGDEVIVVDPETLEQHVSVITKVRSAMRECGALHFGERSLRVTSAHPLYDPRAKQWAPAGDWLLGVRTELINEEGAARVTQAERFVGMEEVFDLSVAHDLHTFVADGVVVHNKQPLPQKCAPAADGATYFEFNRCECGPLIPAVESSAVFCDPDGGAPTCGCSAGDDSTWRTALGTSDAALRDGTWWARVEREGQGEALVVEPMPDATLPVLPGSPNVLRINELGDGSAGFVVRDAQELLSGSLWFWKDGTFPRALSMRGSSLVLLGVDSDRVWLQPEEGGQRWVVNGLPSRAWVKFHWLVTPQGSDYVLQAWLETETSPYIPFHAEGVGGTLEDFLADGGVFSFGDAGVPTELVLGHRSATDGGTGKLLITGVSSRLY